MDFDRDPPSSIANASVSGSDIALAQTVLEVSQAIARFYRQQHAANVSISQAPEPVRDERPRTETALDSARGAEVVPIAEHEAVLDI